MTLTKLLRIKPGVTAVIGSGGKTTLLRTLGGELEAAGGTVLLCTTTKIFPFGGMPNLLSPTEEELAEALRESRLLCAGKLLPKTGKLTVPELPMDRLAALFDFVLAEADGSARRPLKAHASHEPVIPKEANQTVCVVGLSGIGRPIAEAAHRPELFARLSGAAEENAVSPQRIARVLNAEHLADRYFLNQADTEEELERARELATLLDRPAVAGSLQKGAYVSC